MNFTTLELNHTYKSPQDDIINDFYIPVMKNSIAYYRVSGYFNSHSLIPYREGIKHLIKNNGSMKFIISKQISEKDFIAIKNGYELRQKVFQEQLKDFSFQDIVESQQSYELVKDLIRKNILDIKVGFSPKGLFHSKFGLFYDEIGNIIHFSGSNNETYSGLITNYELFNITTNWLSNRFDQGKIETAEQEFNALWEEKTDRNIVYVKKFNDAIKKKLLKIVDESGMHNFQKDKEINTVKLKMFEKHSKVFFLELNSLKSRKAFTEEDFWFRYFLKIYFDSRKGFPFTKSQFSYMKLKEFIEKLHEYSKKHHFKLIIDEKVQDWLDDQDYRIEERRKYGLMIKTQDQLIKENLDYFRYVLEYEMHRKLREQQILSAFFMVEMKRTGNFSVPGSGKTSMVYGAYAYLNSTLISKVDRIVMVGPLSSFETWKEEFLLNFGNLKELKVLDIHDKKISNPEKEILLNIGLYNLILINYESLPKFESVLTQVIDERTMLVFDEVHRVKNPNGIQARSALSISKKPTYKIALTGTPLPNGYGDIYNLLNILHSEEYKNFFNWDYKNLQNVSRNKANSINTKIYPFYWRTNKKELQVPDAERDLIHSYNMNYNEQALFDMLISKQIDNPLVKYIRLMQASTNPKILLKSIDLENLETIEVIKKGELDSGITTNFSKEEVEIIKKVSKTQKYYNALNLIRDLVNKGEKVIVWTVFVQTIQDLVEDLIDIGIQAESVYGDTLGRDQTISNFKNGSIQVLVTNPHTLGESVSLHQVCHNAIYLEYSFNLTHMLQSRDRIHRLGLRPDQKTYYHYFMLLDNKRDSIDKIIYSRLSEKERIMQNAIDKDYLEPLPSSDKMEIYQMFSKNLNKNL